MTDAEIILRFHDLYYRRGFEQTGAWGLTRWMGVPVLKCPMDMIVYQELLHLIRPQLIIETGTRHGGSALFFAHLCDLIGAGEIVTVDVERPADLPSHPRITYLTGSSTDPAIVQQVRDRAEGKSPVFVVLDSDHKASHVLEEMRLYHALVTPGSFMVVEDTNVNGHPTFIEHGPGPMEAIAEFAKENGDFEIDHSGEMHLITMHPNGWLRRKGYQSC
jgi:cephalosporin hydroxylase